MRSLEISTALSGALLLLQSLPLISASSHEAHLALQRLEKRHAHGHRHSHGNERREPRANASEAATLELKKRGGQCQFPTNAGLVAVAPDKQNAGWAMSPDQPCLPGHYCPYACPPGQLMAQWDPSAVAYTYPLSMNGGLKCNDDGSISKPFPDKPYCVDGVGNFQAINQAGDEVAICQTVLPGNEAMLIPTSVKDSATLAVPDTSYWAGTAAHFYVNPPGTSVVEACVWGDLSKPIGNWSPYVAGANMDAHGTTFLKVGWNPIYLEPATPFREKMPNWGVKIECPGGGCNGLPCAIDPAVHKVNECSTSGTIGAGGASFCVVTVPKGSSANLVVFGPGGSGSGEKAKAASVPKVVSSVSSSSSSTLVATSTSSSSASSSETPSSSSMSSSMSLNGTVTSASSSAFTHAPHLFLENSTATTTTLSSSFNAASQALTSVAMAASASSSSAAAIPTAIPAAGALIGSLLGLAALL